MRKLFIACMAGCITLSGCMDKSYDLEDVDWTIGGKIDLTLPSCSTSEIQLKSFIETDEDDIVQVVEDKNGNRIYCLKTTGNADIDQINIARIEFDSPHLQSFDTEIKLRGETNYARRKNAPHRIKINIDIPGTGTTRPIEISDENMYHYDIQKDDAVYDILETVTENIDKDIVTLEYIGIDPNGINLNVKVSGLPTWLNSIYLENLAMEFPEGMVFKDGTFNGHPIKIENNIITLTGAKERVSLTNGSCTLALKLNLEGLHSGETFQFDGTNHIAYISKDDMAKFEVKGTFSIYVKDENGEDNIEQTELGKYISGLILQRPNIVEEIEQDGLKAIIPTNIQIKGDAGFEKKIHITSFSGEAQHEVGEVEKIMMDNMPDFLREEDVVLDLKNPALLLNTSCDVPSDISTSITLTSSESGPTPVTCDLSLRNDKKFYIADNDMSEDLPSEFSEYKNYLKPASGSIGELIEKIPDFIDIHIAPVKMKAENMDITKPYNVNADYTVYAPLTFGENFRMAYRDRETDLAGDLEDLEDLNFGYFEIEAKITSNLPARLKFKLNALDIYGNKISDKYVVITSLDIPANANKTPIKLTLRPNEANGVTINDLINGSNNVPKFDGIEYEAVIEGEEDGTLYENANIKLTDILVSIKGEVSYDIN